MIRPGMRAGLGGVALGVSACGSGLFTAQDSLDSSFEKLQFSAGQAALLAVGQPNLTTGQANQGVSVAAGSLFAPFGPTAISSGRLFVSDSSNQRVLFFSSIPSASGASADGVVGQGDFVSGSYSSATAATLGDPGAVVVYDGKLLVLATNGSRVLIFNSIPAAPGQAADVVVGQSNMTSFAGGCAQDKLSSPQGMAVAGGKLIVADTGNHRVLIWNTIPTTNQAPADVVIGQSNFTSCSSPGSITAGNLDSPVGVAGDGTGLVVADSARSRVLYWQSVPMSAAMAADYVVGQSSFIQGTANAGGGSATASSLSGAKGVAISAGQLYVADTANHRVLVWNSLPGVNGAAADQVLGQGDFVSSASATTASGLSGPTGVAVSSRRLSVSDTDNHRVLIYQGQVLE